jgi:predicted nucleotidyltransferase
VTRKAADWSSPESEQVQRILQLVDDVFGRDVLGAYLHGSAVLGGLRPTSDLDILVVLRRRTTASERRALVEGLLDVPGAQARRGPSRPVELIVVVQSDVRPWRYPPSQEFLYGEWLRDTYELGVAPQPEPAPDLSILITMVLQGNAALVGPPPPQLLDPVPHDDLIRGAVAGIPHLLSDLESDTRNVLLTLARIWTTLETGQIQSKDAAAAWALKQLPREHQPVLAEPEPCTSMARMKSAGATSPRHVPTPTTSSPPSDGSPPSGPAREAFPRERDSAVDVSTAVMRRTRASASERFDTCDRRRTRFAPRLGRFDTCDRRRTRFAPRLSPLNPCD